MILTVLTGDIVNSTDLKTEELEQAFLALNRATAEIAEWQQSDARLTRYRGDGWQFVLTKPRFALRAALKTMAAIQSISERHSTRVAVATGTGHYGEDASLASAGGDAFIASGRALDDMDPQVLLVSSAGGREAALYRLADYIAQGWTPAQSRAIEPMLAPNPPTHAAVAEKLGISRQAVGKALEGASYGAIDHSLRYLEAEYD